MKKKKVLTLMAVLSVSAMLTACGEKKEETAVVESTVAESTVEESIVAESTEFIEDNSDVALAESVEETEATTETKELSVVEYNAQLIGDDLGYSDQGMEVAQALEGLGFGRYESIENMLSKGILIKDDKGMMVVLQFDPSGNYFEYILAEDEKTVLWKWEYTDKYQKAENEASKKRVEEILKKKEEQKKLSE